MDSNISNKKYLRLQNKKKKLLALIDMIKLNEKDRTIIDQTVENTGPIRKKLKPDIEIENERQSSSSEDQYLRLKREVTQRLQSRKYIPTLRLKLQGELALLKTEASERVPIFLTDVQHLLGNILIGERFFTPSRWLTLQKSSKISHTIVLIVEGVSLYNFSTFHSSFIATSRHFKNQLEVILPSLGDKIVEELIAIPLTYCQLEFLTDYYGSLDLALKSTNPMWIMKSIFPIKGIYHLTSEEKNINLPATDAYPRTHLLLSPLQMVDASYPLPLAGILSLKYNEYVPTKDEYIEVSPASPMFGLDCEMCKIKDHSLALARITIVDESYNIIYETLVSPETEIINYMTAYSGITKDMLKNVTKSLKDVQRDIRNLLPKDAILVGHSLNIDLDAMKMMHPYVIDTSIIFNRTGERQRKTKLKHLVKEFFNETIQCNIQGHDSAEDSIYTLKLAQLKLKKNLEFGDILLANRRRAALVYKDLNSEKKEIKLSVNMLHQINKKDITTTVINTINTDYQKHIDGKIIDAKLEPNSHISCIKECNNKNAITKTCQVALQNALTITHVVIPPSKVEESKLFKTLSQVDQWISKIHDAAAVNGLLVVILAGNSKNQKSGVALIKIKQH